MSLLVAVLVCSALIGLFAYYKAQLHTQTPSIALLATTPAYSFASTTAISRTPQRSFNIDRHRTPLSLGWSRKSCATALSIKSLGAASVSTYNEDPDNLDVEVSECETISTRTALSIPQSPIQAAH